MKLFTETLMKKLNVFHNNTLNLDFGQDRLKYHVVYPFDS